MCNLSPPRLPMIHDQQSLTLRWRSFSWWGMEDIAICFAYKGSQNSFMTQYTISEVSFPRRMTKNHWRSLDAHFHDGAGGYCYLFLPRKAAKNSFMTEYNLSEVWFPRTHDQNNWRSVDAHFHDGAGRVLLSVLPIKAAKNSFVTEYNQSEVLFPRTYDQKSLTLRWRSFAMAVSTICNHSFWHNSSFTVFWLLSGVSCTFFWSLRCSLIIHRYI